MSDPESNPEYRHLLAARGLDAQQIPADPARVAIVIPDDVAHLPRIQHTAWLLTTLLTRSTTAVVEEISISCPVGTEICAFVAQRPASDGSLMSTLLSAAKVAGPDASPVIQADPATSIAPTLRIVIGGTDQAAGNPAPEAIHITGAGYVGAIDTSPRAVQTRNNDSTNPIGPYIAACLAAGHVFLSVRLSNYAFTASSIDGWTLCTGEPDLFTFEEPDDVELDLDHVLAGVGAVGSALLQVLWASPNVRGKITAVDADADGIDVTNLNRCLIFGYDDIGSPKATTAARLLSRPGLTIAGYEGLAEEWVTGQTHLISAVDTPEARGALQDRYPASIIQASTRDLRLEMLRVDPTRDAACLRCYNEPRKKTSDADLRKSLEKSQISGHARAIGVSEADILAWAGAGGCGVLGDRMLERLRQGAGSAAEFSVGFLSVLAGILLAGQAVKDAVARLAQSPSSAVQSAIPPLGLSRSRFILNFLNPITILAGVRTYKRDPSCPACHGIRREIWLRRWTG